MTNSGELNLNRRDLMVGAGACAALAAGPLAAGAQPAPVGTPVTARVSLTVNGASCARWSSTRAPRCSTRCASTCS